MATVIGQPFTLNDWLVEPSLNRISRGDEIVKIDPQNMKVLELLVSRPGEVFSQAEIEQYAWPGVVVTPNSVYQSIAQLRRALGDSKASPAYIETIPRKGYRLIAAQGADASASCSSVKAPLPETMPTKLRLGVASLLILVAVFVATEALLIRTPASIAGSGASGNVLDGLSSEGINETQASVAQIDLLRSAAQAALTSGKPREAREILIRTLHIEERLPRERHLRMGDILCELSTTNLWMRDYEAAESYAREALETYTLLPDAHPTRVWALSSLGYVLTEVGKYEEAESLLMRATVLSREVYGDRSIVTTDALVSLSDLYLAQGRLDLAEKTARESLDLALKLGNGYLGVSHARGVLAQILTEKGQLVDALSQAQLQVRELSSLVPPDHPYLASARELLGRTLLRMRSYQRAEDELRTALKIWEAGDGWSARVARTSTTLGKLLLETGRIQHAEKHLARASQLVPPPPLGRRDQEITREHSLVMQELLLAKRAMQLASTARPERSESADLRDSRSHWIPE